MSIATSRFLLRKGRQHQALVTDICSLNHFFDIWERSGPLGVEGPRPSQSGSASHFEHFLIFVVRRHYFTC